MAHRTAPSSRCSHLAGAHGGRYLCDLCSANRAVFVMELRRYTARELAAHCREGEPEAGFPGHPLCALCDRRFYGETELIEHLVRGGRAGWGHELAMPAASTPPLPLQTREHFNCHLCPRAADRRAFFGAYADLERHFGRRHFSCREPACVQTRFVVFDTSLELQVGRGPSLLLLPAPHAPRSRRRSMRPRCTGPPASR